MIDYNIISESINYYESKSFVRIESPWIVTEYIDKLTKPYDANSFKLKDDKCLVASGEQSFLYLYLKNFLPKGQFQTTTPCYRSDSFDYLHSKYFIKNELIKTDIVNNNELDKITDICFNFFKKKIPDVSIISTKDGFDIEYSGNELGSYGIRENEYLKWIYATGCAEPRFSKIINLYNKYGY